MIAGSFELPACTQMEEDRGRRSCAEEVDLKLIVEDLF